MFKLPLFYSFIGPVNCPFPFVWKQAANLCYHANENNLDWQTAKTNCEALGYGARLAILDTNEKLNSILDGKYSSSNGKLFSFYL